MANLKEKKLSSKIIFQGKLLELRCDTVKLPNGKTSTREWIKHPGAVCIIPILPNNKLCLIKQYRYPIQQTMIELPAGKLDDNEEPEACAKRELEEETGYITQNIQYLTEIHPAIGFADEKMSLFIAKELIKTKQNCDKDEFLEIFPTNIDIAIDMVWKGQITDVKTIIGILWADKIINR